MVLSNDVVGVMMCWEIGRGFLRYGTDYDVVRSAGWVFWAFWRRSIGGFRDLRVCWGDEGELLVREGARLCFSVRGLGFR